MCQENEETLRGSPCCLCSAKFSSITINPLKDTVLNFLYAAFQGRRYSTRLENGNKSMIKNYFIINKPLACKYIKQYSVIIFFCNFVKAKRGYFNLQNSM